MKDLIDEYRQQIRLLEVIEESDRLKLARTKQTMERERLRRKIQTTEQQIFDLALAVNMMEE